MSKARKNADGQCKKGFVVLPIEDYDALYFAAYAAKKWLTQMLEHEAQTKEEQ